MRGWSIRVMETAETGVRTKTHNQWSGARKQKGRQMTVGLRGKAWRWGVNDYDEAAITPYAYDVVRLATSARLAPRLKIAHAEIAAAILEGYGTGLLRPRSILLDEDVQWLRPFANSERGENREFWQEVEGYPDADPPREVQRLLKKSLPDDAKVLRFASRLKGGNSLGRPRFRVIATWQSGMVIREAKAWVPSAWDWAHEEKGRPRRLIDLAYGTYRSPDPMLAVGAKYVIRRVAPDNRKVEVAYPTRTARPEAAGGDGCRLGCGPRRERQATPNQS